MSTLALSNLDVGRTGLDNRDFRIHTPVGNPGELHFARKTLAGALQTVFKVLADNTLQGTFNPDAATYNTTLASTAFVQDAVGAHLSKVVTGGTVTLTEAEAACPALTLTGTLVSNLTLVVPITVKRLWIVANVTTGAFTVTLKTAAGTGVPVTQGRRSLVYTEGVNVYNALTDFTNLALTGVPTAPTAAVDTNTTQIATTAFVLAQASGSVPAALGTAAVGTGTRFARENHVHAMPTLDALANTTITANVAGEILKWSGTAWINNTLAEAGIAPVASPALTGTPTAPTAADGTNTTQIASTAFVQAAVGGLLPRTITGGTLTLTDAEASNPVIEISGVLTSNATLVVPATIKRLWAIYNRTTGAFTLTVKTPTGTGIVVTQGKRNLVYITTSGNLVDAVNDFDGVDLTGAATAVTAPVDTNSTRIATTAFVLGQASGSVPAALGTAAVGTGFRYARENHVHAMPTLDALANTTITANVAGEILKWSGTAWINNTLAEAGIAPVASPALTGTPTAPTAAMATNTTQLATTAFVQAVNSSDTGGSSTALTLKTARKIGGVLFNGGADIDLPGVNVAGTQNTTGNANTATTATQAAKLSTPRGLNGAPFDGQTDVFVPELFVEILSAANFDNYRTPGEYYVSANATAITILNIPEGVAGALSVKASNYPGVIQTYTTWDSGVTRKIYQRTCLSSLVWGAWSRIYTSIDPQPSAATLTTARTIALSGGATGTATSFNGGANIVIPVTALDMASATAGILAVARGGTGVATSTGTGSVVLSASPTFTGAPVATTATDGTDTTQIATTAFVQAAVGGYLSKAVTGGTVTLTAAEASNPVIALTGTLTSALNLVVPSTVKRLWTIYNATAGAFTTTVKTAAGSGVVVSQTKRTLVYTDGTNVAAAFTDFESPAMTGTPTAPTAAAGTNNTQVANTAFVKTVLADPTYLATQVRGMATGGLAQDPDLATDPVMLTSHSNAPLGGGTYWFITTTYWATFNTNANRAQLAITYNAATAQAAVRQCYSGVWTQWVLLHNLVSPAFTGVPTAPTAAAGTNTTQLATTAFVQGLLVSPTFTGDPKAPLAAQFDNDTSLATTAFVKRAGGSYSGISQHASATVLTAAQAGNMLILSGSTNYNLTLPLSSTLPVGTTFTALNVGTGKPNFATSGADAIGRSAGIGGLTTVPIGQGDTMEITSVTGGWYVTGGTAVTQTSDMFAASMGWAGYQKFPSGLIMQWQQITVSPSATADIAYPIAFPTAGQGIWAKQNDATVSGSLYRFDATMIDRFTFRIANTYGGGNIAGHVLSFGW